MGIIGSIRKHAWVAVALVGLAIVAFILQDDSLKQFFGKDNTFAKVNGETIEYNTFEQEVEKQKINYAQQYQIQNFTNQQEHEIRNGVWDNMLMQRLLNEELEALALGVRNEKGDITITPAELSAMFSGEIADPFVMQNLADPATGKINAAQLKQYLDHFDQLDTTQRQQWVAFENSAAQNRVYNKYMALISKGFYTPTAIAKQIAEMGTNVADVRVVKMPLESVSDEDAALKEEDYKNYYNLHKEDYRQNEEVRELQYVVFDVMPTQKDLQDIQNDVMKIWEEFQASPEEEIPYFVASESSHYDSTYKKASELPAPFDTIVPKTGAGNFIAPLQFGNQWYMAKVLSESQRPDSMKATVVYVLNNKAQANITRTDEQAKLRADSVAALLKSNKISLEDAMAQYSDYPSNGADTMWMPDGAFADINEDMVKTPVGGVFTFADKGNRGYYVVKVTGKTALQKKYRVAIIDHEIVPSIATNNAVRDEAKSLVVNNHTYAELLASAQEKNIPMRTAYCRMMDNNLANINNVRDIVRWAFNEDTKAGDVSNDAFNTENAYIVVAVKEVYKKGVPEFAQIRALPEFETAVRTEKKKEILIARAEDAKKQAKDLAGIAAKMGSTIDSLSAVSFNSNYLGGYGMEPSVIGAISANKTQKMVGPVKGAQGVYMVQIDQVQNMPAADVNAIRAGMNQMAQRKAYIQKLYQVLKNNAKIKDQRILYY